MRKEGSISILVKWKFAYNLSALITEVHFSVAELGRKVTMKLILSALI